MPKLHPKTQAALDMICYLILLYFTIIRLYLKKVTITAKIRTLVISILLAFLFVSSLMVIVNEYVLT